MVTWTMLNSAYSDIDLVSKVAWLKPRKKITK